MNTSTKLNMLMSAVLLIMIFAAIVVVTMIAGLSEVRAADGWDGSGSEGCRGHRRCPLSDDVSVAIIDSSTIARSNVSFKFTAKPKMLHKF